MEMTESETKEAEKAKKGESSEKKSPVGEFLLKMACAYPYGMAVSFVQSACEKQFRQQSFPVSVLTRWLHKPQKNYQMKGLETIVFGPEIGSITPPVEALASIIFHRIQILVGRSPACVLDVDDLDDLMKKTFGRSFAPESWGFLNFTYFYNFLFKHFQLYHKTAVLRRGDNGKLVLSSSHPFVGDIFDCMASYRLAPNISFYTELVLDNAKRKDKETCQ